MIQAKDLRVCRALHKKHGKSYYFAARLFPRDIRIATHVLYAFFRVPDEIVDNPTLSGPMAVLLELQAFRRAWRDACAGRLDAVRPAWLPVLRATAIIINHYKIPTEYGEEFLRAMLQDVEKSRYQTYAELEKYMYGSAAVVGLMMTHVIGFEDERALLHAEELGYAMQLTNFLRDVDDDFLTRGRIYLPLKELQSFGLSEDDIKNRHTSDMFQRFMSFQASRARALYLSADEGIELLNEDGRYAVRLAAALYEAILDKLEEQKMNPFAGRARTTFWEKVRIAWRMRRQKMGPRSPVPEVSLERALAELGKNISE